MMEYNETLKKAVVLLTVEGLRPPSLGARVSFTGDTPIVTRGPHTGTKEILGGFWLIQAKTLDEAIDWARHCPTAKGDIIEVRPVHELTDFPPEVREVAANLEQMQCCRRETHAS
jgi:hypothetical protein